MKKIIFLLFIFSTLAFGDSVSDMKKRLASIDRGIKESSQRINAISGQKKNTAQKIKSLEDVILEVEGEIDSMNTKLNTLSNRIDYSERGLAFISTETKIQKASFDAKLLAWEKTKVNEEKREALSYQKHRFRELLYGDLNTLKKINDVKVQLDQSKADVERDRDQIRSLRNELLKREKDNEVNKQKLETLVRNLDGEQRRHKSRIVSLKSQKKKIQLEIDRIIKSNSTSKPVLDISLQQAKDKVGGLRKPIAGNYSLRFGETKSGVTSSHIEIRSKLGTYVRAAASGEVIYVGSFKGLGKVVMVDYGYNLIGVYGNLITTTVKEGQKVTKADKVGILGKSSNKTPDLYYELRFKLKPVNPVGMFQ